MLTAIGLPPGGSSAVHIYTQTVHRTTQNKQYTEQHNNFGCHPVAVVQYTFTHKQYTERHNETVHRTTQQFWLSPGGSSTVHIYTQTIHRATQ